MPRWRPGETLFRPFRAGADLGMIFTQALQPGLRYFAPSGLRTAAWLPREALRQAEHLFASLLHRAFRGEL